MLDQIKERVSALENCDRLKTGCPICGGYTPLIYSRELGWQIKCDICETIFADDKPHWDRNEALRFYTEKFQETRKFMKIVEGSKNGK